METGMKSLEVSPHFTKSKSSGGNSYKHVQYEYISLKDILGSSRGRRSRRNFNASGHELLPGIDPSAINIRNPLVRHAATIYLQSAALIATRDQSFMERVWQRCQQRERCNWGCMGDIFSIFREYVARFLASNDSGYMH
ncbi:hypothetical protein LUZ61_014999 [Rhynchospora tenuis]|uniref:Uncharacterized protein n=1 Tax=Rhynchospora tenuis TaxID=198213 RepID=A0AAD5Z1P7_9POAL|nr:hypothetical protein LUZ61_014999 [Rhynchospora tenuis]